MDYNFKKYTQAGKKFETRMSITKTGHIGLPTQFYKNNKIANYKFAVIYYDKDKRTVGVKFTKEREIGALLISKNHDGYGGYVSAKNFFAFNQIDAKKYAQRYEYEKIPLHQVGLDGTDSLFVIRLEEKPRKTSSSQTGQPQQPPIQNKRAQMYQS